MGTAGVIWSGKILIIFLTALSLVPVLLALKNSRRLRVPFEGYGATMLD
jgi:maltodextrin utilization protein YvdJ